MSMNNDSTGYMTGVADRALEASKVIKEGRKEGTCCFYVQSTMTVIIIRA